MAFEIISMPADELLEAFQELGDSLWYPSETDAKLEVFILSSKEVGDAFSQEDLIRLYYSGEDQPRSTSSRWAEANRLVSNGTMEFFRDLCDVITTYADNTYLIHEAHHREYAHDWRELRNLFFDNLVHQKFIRISLAEPDQARHDLYLVGRHIEIQEDPDTNELRTQLLDWFVIKTFVIET